MKHETQDLLTGVEAQQIVNTSLDMLDALECLILFASEHYPDDLTLDVWKKAAKVIKTAGGTTFDNLKA